MIHIDQSVQDQMQLFKNEVLSSQDPVLIDFYADWCGPCQMIMPEIEKLDAMADGFKVCKVNVDAAGELAAEFGVRSIPALFVVKGGTVVAGNDDMNQVERTADALAEKLKSYARDDMAKAA